MRERHRENAACAPRCLWDHSCFWQAFSDRSVSVGWLRGRASLLSKPTVLCVGGTIWVADASRLGGKAQLGLQLDAIGQWFSARNRTGSLCCRCRSFICCSRFGARSSSDESSLCRCKLANKTEQEITARKLSACAIDSNHESSTLRRFHAESAQACRDMARITMQTNRR
jgi:hypothetical protein